MTLRRIIPPTRTIEDVRLLRLGMDTLLAER